MSAVITAPLWSDGAESSRRPHLSDDESGDVIIVGAGFSGLWLAYWLSELDPRLDIAIVDRAHVGYGASGRNGGWASALLPTSLSGLSLTLGDESVHRLQRIMFDAVRELGEICSDLAIDCDYARGGTVSSIATTGQRDRAVADIADYRRFGFDDHIRLLDEESTAKRIAFHGESVFRPDCAVLHPRRLVNGLADVVESRGVRIFESTSVTGFAARRVSTDRGEIRGRIVVDCREAYGAPESRRGFVPIYSMMIATEPLPESVWADIGLKERESFTDHRHQLIYGQRTVDGRIAFGGRGLGYRYGSRLRSEFDAPHRVHRHLRQSLVELFPTLHDVAITHVWGGPLAVTRDWTWSCDVHSSPETMRIGGYAGDGVTSSFVAGRTLAHEIVFGDSDFPLVDHRSPRWEPEPLRWLGINSLVRMAGWLDLREGRGKSNEFLGRIFDKLSGRRS